MARAIVELARDSLGKKKNLDWLKELAMEQYEQSVKPHIGPADAREKAKHNQKILLWHNIIEVIDGKKWKLPKFSREWPGTQQC